MELMINQVERAPQVQHQQAMQAQRDKKTKCHNCGKLGHIKAEYYSSGGGKEGRGSEQKAANKAEKKDRVKVSFLAVKQTILAANIQSYASAVKKGLKRDSDDLPLGFYIVIGLETEAWIMDSDAIYHMCSNVDLMHDMKSAKTL